jgi:hypothetical protein
VEKALAKVPFVEKEPQRAFVIGYAAGMRG